MLLPILIIRLTAAIGILSAMLAGAALVVGRSLPEIEVLTYTAFFSRRGYNAMDIYTLDITRWLTARMTTGDGVYEDSMWSPDGQHMAYIQEKSNEQRLYVMDAATHVVTGLGGHVYTSLIGWSPDSRYIAFQTVDYSAARINLADITSGDDAPINVPDIANARIFWTAASDHLFYMLKSGLQNETLYGLEAACRPLDAACTGYEIATLPFNYLAPARALYEWSPDGQTLVLSGAAGYQLDLYTLRLTCLPPSRCTVQVEQLTDTPDDETAPAWSPDGEHIAYVADHSSVGILDVASGEQHLIYAGDRAIRWLEYSPDGRWIVLWSTDKKTEYIAYIDLIDTLTGRLYPVNDGGISHWFPAWQPRMVQGQ